MPSVPSKLLLLLIPSLTPYLSARFDLQQEKVSHFIGVDRFATDKVTNSWDMSSVCGELGFQDADFDISASQCSNGSMLSSNAGCDESQESDGDETGYINQTGDEEYAEKGYGKSTLESLPLNSSDDEDKNENLTTTTPVVLIPAIKGSREKHGLSLRKSTVSWADDVYDPPPSIASHTRHKKPQQQKSKRKDSHKKTGKKGQKNKDSSSSRSGKNKKQASSRKHSYEKFDWVTQLPIVAASS